MALTLEARYRRDAALRRLSLSKARHLPLNERLIWARVRKGLSQDRLAAKIGMNRVHLLKLEQGKHRPNPDTRARLAKALGQPAELFADEDEEDD